MILSSLVVLGALLSTPDDEQLPTSLGEELVAVEPPAPQEGRIPQPRKPEIERPFFDFERSEINPFVGIAMFSGNFDADPDYVVGLHYRVPLPQIGEFGGWVQALFAHVDRDLDPFLYDSTNGNFMGFGAGMDYDLLTWGRLLLRPQAGLMHLGYDNVDGAEDGFGVLLGAVFNLTWVNVRQRVGITYNPQWLFDGEDWVFFHNIGLSIGF